MRRGQAIQPPSWFTNKKINGSLVEVTKAYKKINGAWVEQSLDSVFESSVNYIEGA